MPAKQSLAGEESQFNLCSNIEPYRILDIQNRGSKDKVNFKFVVIFVSVMNQNQKRR